MERITAGITLFNPDIERLKENIEAIFTQVETVYLVDNGSDNIGNTEKLLENYKNCSLIKNDKNLGIAKALNQLCSIALSEKSDWICLLDQDSVVEKEIIKKYNRYTGIERVAVITPCIDDENEADIIKSSVTQAYEPVHRCYTSASLTNLMIWKEVGGFDEDMFIDCVDFDYCTTLEEHGYIILRDNEAILHHILGCAQEVRAFMVIGRLFNIKKLKKPFYTYNHPPLRTYYYARNIKYYAYKHRKSINKFTEYRVYIQWVVLKLFFEKDKWNKLCAIIKGRRDANKMIKKLKAKGI